jgi:hypothetical protein
VCGQRLCDSGHPFIIKVDVQRAFKDQAAHEDSPDKLAVVQNLKMERGARTGTLDPKTRRIFLASAEFEPLPQGTAVQRPKMVPGSFKVLAYGP